MHDLLERLRSAISDRYAVEREIGRGGMATVYLAEDARHHRKVAIKVLHPELAAAVGSDRFLQEIEIVAGLTHAHILPLFDSGEAKGLLYYIMPYVEGESLRERMKREAPLPTDVAVRIASEVADGLGYAHQHGIVHRDVKPGNILLSDEHAYITDFGIARALDTAAGGELTQTGIAVGTPTYMSPEQAAGEKEIDARSDVYALGCVLYEMLSGEPPFTGTTPQAVMVRRVTEDARPIRQIRHNVPPSVEKALSRALARQPDARFSTCEQFGRALVPAGGLQRRIGSFLRRFRYTTRSRLLGRPGLASAVGAALLALVALVGWLTLGSSWISFGTGPPTVNEPTPTSDIARVAILYFEDLSEDGSLQSYAAGFTKGLIRRVNAVEGLSAPSYTAMRQFRDSSVSPSSLAATLQVDYLAEGTVLPTVQGLQVEVDLVDPATGLHVGYVQQQAPLANLADLLETVADSLALALRPELGEQVRRRQLRAETSSDEALDLVWRADALRGESEQLMLLEMPDREGAEALLMRADSLLAQSEGLDPTWAEPSIQRGWIAHDRAMVFTEDPKEYGLGRLGMAQEGVNHANRALELKADDPLALELRGTIRYGLAKREQSDASRHSLMVGAEADLRASVAADPRRATAWRVLGDLLNGYAADFEGAKQAFRRALEVDRFLDGASELTANLIGLSTDLEDYDEAWQWMLEGRRRWPEDVTFPYTAVLIMASRQLAGDVERAWAYSDTVQYTWPGDRKDQYLPVLYADIAAVLGLAGLEDSAHAVLERGIAASPDSAFPAYNVAHAYLVLGDADASLQWLGIDLEAYPGEKATRAIEPWFRALHGNPDFETLVQVKNEAED